MEQQPATSTIAQSAPARRRPYFLLGTLVFFSGMIIYIVQFSTKHLVAPWHVPILGTIGVLLMLASTVQRPGILRIIGLLLFIGLAGMEWYFLLGSKMAPYTGPAKPGEKLPAFTATLAKDDSSFTNQTLGDGKSTVLVFFRGHW